jgi:hypothetical protein
MKIDFLACVLFASTGIAVLLARAPSALDVEPPASVASEADSCVVRPVELTAPSAPRRWFPPLAQLLADPSLNPDGATLSAEAKREALAVLEQASAALNDIDAQFTQTQALIARPRIERGLAEPYVDGVSDRNPHDGDAAVVIARIDDGRGPWLVRIPHDELPQAAIWRQEVAAIRESVDVDLRRLVAAATTQTESLSADDPKPLSQEP